MKRVYTVFLALFLCCLVFSALAIETVRAIPLILIGLGVSFLIGAITGGLIDHFLLTSAHVVGAEEGQELLNVGNEWGADWNNTRLQYNNYASLMATAYRYYWQRQAEYVAQQYINETVFPYDKVLAESGILSEYINNTKVNADSLENLVNVLNDYCKNTVPALTQLDIQTGYPADGLSLENTKNLAIGNLMYHMSVGTSELSLGYYYYDSAMFGAWLSDANNDFGCMTTTPTALTFTYKAYDSVGGLVWSNNVTTLSNGGSYAIEFDGSLNNGEVYELKVVCDKDSYYTDTVIPFCFIPKNSTYTDALAGTCLWNKATAHDVTHNEPVSTLLFLNSSVNILTLNVGTFTEFRALMSTMNGKMEDAMAGAQVHWSTLRGLGYTNYTELPVDMIVPPPSIVNIGSDITDKLSPEQLQVVYYAYLKGMANFFSSTNYQTANLTGSDVVLADFDLLFNATVYNSVGNDTVFSNQLCMLIPTTSSLTLSNHVNNTLLQSVEAVTFSGVGNATTSFYGLSAGCNIYINDVLVNGVVSNQSVATITKVTLRTVANEYDFSLEGEERSSGGVDMTSLMALLVPVLMIAMIIPMFVSKRRR